MSPSAVCRVIRSAQTGDGTHGRYCAKRTIDVTKSQRFRKRFGDPYADTGPRACLRTEHVSGPCSRCGRAMEPAHSPLRLAGIYCTACCPCCATPETGGQAA
jgi:hypothetical protein